MNVRGGGLFLTLTAICVLASACTKPPADAAAGSGGSAGRGNACQLLDREDMERLHGAPVTTLHNVEAEDRTTCEVYDAATNQAFFYLEATWKGGKAQAGNEGTASGIAAGVLGGSGVNLEPLTGTGAGAKAADRAYYSDVATPWVLKGDVLLRFRMAGLTQDQKSANFVPLARKALDRLQ